jgi:hypothetical protein
MLLQCALEVLLNAKELPKSIPNKIVEPLLQLAVSASEPEIRAKVVRVFVALLSINKRTSLMQSISAEQRMERFVWQLRSSLFQQATMKDNLPENFVAIYDTLALLFLLYRGQELEHSIPLLFKLEEMATNKEKPLLPHLARGAHSIVGAFLLVVAESYGLTELEVYLQQTMINSWSPVLHFDQGKLHAKKSKFKKEHRKAPPLEQAIDREKVVSALCSVSLLVQEFATRDLRQVLTKEMSTGETNKPAPVQPKIPISSLVPLETHGQPEKAGVNLFKDIFESDDEEMEGEKKEFQVQLPKHIPYEHAYKLATAKAKDRRAVLSDLGELLSIFVDKNASLNSSLVLNYPTLEHATLI